MRGRRPKPTRVREIAGDRGKRRLNRSEPEFSPATAADCPAWLSDGAKKEWRRLAPALIKLGLLTKADLVAFAGYCQCYAHWVEAEEFIRQHGMTATLRDDKGSVKAVIPVPQVGIAIKMLDKIRQFAAEFGFTPSARGRIELDKAGADVGDLTEEELIAEYEAIKSQLAKEAGGHRETAVH